MKKYLPYILLLLLLSVLLGWYLIANNKSTLNKAEGDFKISDKTKVGRIILHDDKKRTIDLEYKDGVWLLNGKYQARQDLIEQLIDIMGRLQSEAPVAKAAHQNVLKQMLSANIQVQIYYKGEAKPEKVYYVGGPTIDSKGTYMLLEVDGKPVERPYIVRVPGMDAYLTPAYEMEEDVWRSRTVFSLKPEQVKEIKVEYPLDKFQSFSVKAVNKDSFVLKNAVGEVEMVKQGYLFAYASMFADVQIESFENGNEEKDLILKGTPYAIVSVTDYKSSTQTAKLYFMPINRRSKKTFDEEGNDLKVDIDRLYIAFNNQADFGVAQMYVWGRILRNFQDFLNAGKSPQSSPRKTL